MPSSISECDWAALKTRLIDQAKAEGFAEGRITLPDAIPQAPGRLDHFLEKKRHGTMAWMEERRLWRADPSALWPEARAVLMLAEPYTPHHDPLAVLDLKDHAAISVYAQGRDYHDVVKKRLKRVGRWLMEQGPKGHQIKVFVDTAPVMEKPLAQAAGLGWQGKHTNLLSRSLGNWFFLGAIFTTMPLPPDTPEVEHCGSCRKCLDICPTGAFPAPFQLDARRCISYLTIEHHGPIPEDLRVLMGNRIYGCDDCLAVCPWNKFAREAHEIRYLGDPAPPLLAELAALDDAAFRARFSGSPIKRIGRDRFVRNVLYAIGNSGLVSLSNIASNLVDDPAPVVSDAARWAVDRLSGTPA